MVGKGKESGSGGDKFDDHPKETILLSGHIAKDAITDDPQAAPYEPKFKTFSGGNDQFLSAVSKQGQAVSEFAIEDKEKGRIYTASGEHGMENSYRPRLSFLIGLQAATKDAPTAEERERLQSVFSIDYMMRKAKELMGFSQPTKLNGAQDINLIALNPSSDKKSPDKKSDAADVKPAPDERPTDFLNGIIWDLTKKHGVPAAEVTKGWFGKSYGEIHPVPSVGQGILESCNSILNDPRRTEGGEFHVAFGRQSGGPLSASSLWYTTSPETAPDQSENHTASDLVQMATNQYKLDAIIHSHPHRKGYSEFSYDDIHQADQLVNLNPNFRSFLLTPPPENKLLMYSPEMHISTHAQAVAAGRIKELGHFNAAGKFVAEREHSAILKQLGFIRPHSVEYADPI